MLAFEGLHFNHNMSSQLKLHSIKKPLDFTFCDIPKKIYHQDDHNEGFSPRLWSQNNHSNFTSSSSSMNTMVEGRKELMELIDDVPESWYELSLKDMVAKEPDDSGLVMEDKVDMKPKLKGKKKSSKTGPISRSVSLDTGVFLLKMFIPSSFESKKHKVSRSTSVDRSKKRHVDVKQWKNWRFVENRSNISSRSYNESRCTTATKNKNRFHSIFISIIISTRVVYLFSRWLIRL